MTKLEIPYTHGFKVHVPNLLTETVMGACRPKDAETLRIPLIIFVKYLVSVAERCSEINDPILDRLMVEMALYSTGDPESPDYDENIVTEIIKTAKDYIKSQRDDKGTIYGV